MKKSLILGTAFVLVLAIALVSAGLFGVTGKALWDGDWCTTANPCPAGEGDCDWDKHCQTGYCAANVGADYGQAPGMDVCENPCVDSDGINNFTTGNISIKHTRVLQDRCEDSSMLREFFCQENTTEAYVRINCSEMGAICINGACECPTGLVWNGTNCKSLGEIEAITTMLTYWQYESIRDSDLIAGTNCINVCSKTTNPYALETIIALEYCYPETCDTSHQVTVVDWIPPYATLDMPDSSDLSMLLHELTGENTALIDADVACKCYGSGVPYATKKTGEGASLLDKITI